MTAQISDKVFFQNDWYWTIPSLESPLFDPSQYQMVPQEASSGCWRGYYCEFNVFQNLLVLESLYIRLNESSSSKNPHLIIGPTINKINPRSGMEFNSLDKKLDFTSFIHPRKMKLDLSVNQLRRFIFKRMKKYFNYFVYNLEDHI